jgi:hypothetical protein
MVMRFLVDWCAKNGGLNGMEGQTLLACGSKVIVGFRNLMDRKIFGHFGKRMKGVSA